MSVAFEKYQTSGEEIILNRSPPVAPGSFPLSLAPGVPHADQRNGFVLEVGQQSVTHTHLLHCSYRVRVAFHQPVRHPQLNFMRLCLMKLEEPLVYYSQFLCSVETKTQTVWKSTTDLNGAAYDSSTVIDLQ